MRIVRGLRTHGRRRGRRRNKRRQGCRRPHSVDGLLVGGAVRIVGSWCTARADFEFTEGNDISVHSCVRVKFARRCWRIYGRRSGWRTESSSANYSTFWRGSRGCSSGIRAPDGLQVTGARFSMTAGTKMTGQTEHGWAVSLRSVSKCRPLGRPTGVFGLRWYDVAETETGDHGEFIECRG